MGVVVGLHLLSTNAAAKSAGGLQILEKAILVVRNEREWHRPSIWVFARFSEALGIWADNQKSEATKVLPEFPKSGVCQFTGWVCVFFCFFQGFLSCGFPVPPNCFGPSHPAPWFVLCSLF